MNVMHKCIFQKCSKDACNVLEFFKYCSRLNIYCNNLRPLYCPGCMYRRLFVSQHFISHHQTPLHSIVWSLQECQKPSTLWNVCCCHVIEILATWIKPTFHFQSTLTEIFKCYELLRLSITTNFDFFRNKHK